MPSKRRRFLRTLPLAAVGLTGCSSLQPNEQADNRTATSSAEGDSSSYEPTTPAENDSQTPYEKPEYVVQTPVYIFIRNYRNASHTVRLTLDIESSSEGPREALNGTYEAPARGTLKISAYEQNGQYHFTAAVDDERHEETVYISMKRLADCNAIGAGVELDESGVSIYSEGTTAGCPPVTATPDVDGFAFGAPASKHDWEAIESVLPCGDCEGTGHGLSLTEAHDFEFTCTRCGDEVTF